MKIQIINDRKKDFSYVNKVKIKFTSEGVNIEEVLHPHQLTELYFTIGEIVKDYWAQKPKDKE